MVKRNRKGKFTLLDKVEALERVYIVKNKKNGQGNSYGVIVVPRCLIGESVILKINQKKEAGK